MEEEIRKDKTLWRIAVKRAKFRKSFYAYAVITAFLWGVWWFTMGRHTGFTGYPWPVWVTLGWGIAIALQYVDAYYGNKQDIADREYEKLKNQQGL